MLDLAPIQRCILDSTTYKSQTMFRPAGNYGLLKDGCSCISVVSNLEGMTWSLVCTIDWSGDAFCLHAQYNQSILLYLSRIQEYTAYMRMALITATILCSRPEYSCQCQCVEVHATPDVLQELTQCLIYIFSVPGLRSKGKSYHKTYETQGMGTQSRWQWHGETHFG